MDIGAQFIRDILESKRDAHLDRVKEADKEREKRRLADMNLMELLGALKDSGEGENEVRGQLGSRQ